MRLETAFEILQLKPGASAAEIRAAYKKRAFATHPDHSGDPGAFLRVQAAYELLKNSPHEEGVFVDDAAADDVEEPGFEALNQRIRDVRRAFVQLLEQVDADTDTRIHDFIQKVWAQINSYDSVSTLKQNAQQDMNGLFQKFVTELSQHVEKQVRDIADSQDRWLREYLRPTVKQAKYDNPARFSERLSGVMSLLLVNGLAFYYISLSHNFWVLLPSVALLAATFLAPYRYHKRFDVGRIVTGLSFADIAKAVRIEPQTSDAGFSTEASVGGGSLIGVGLGLAFGGPLGALLGGIAGGLLGSLFGKGLGEYKQELFEAVAESIDQQLPGLFRDLEQRINQARDTMIADMRANFVANLGQVVKLLVGR